MKTIHYIFILAALAVGYFLGRASTQTTEKIVWKEGKTVYGSVPQNLLTAKAEFPTSILNLPIPYWICDTVWITETEYIHTPVKADTAAVFDEFMKRKEYEFPAFDDENGTYISKPVVQFNSLVKYDYAFTPRYKEITKIDKRLFTLFVSASFSTFDLIGAGGGMFINDFGIEYQYQFNYLTGESGHMVGGKIKF